MQALPKLARDAAKTVVVATLFVYPVAIYFADGYLSPSQLLAGLLFLFGARVLLAAWIKPEHHKRDLWFAALLAAAAFLVLFFMPEVHLDWLRLYPAVISLSVLGVFFGSLFTARSAVERIARVMHSDLPPQGVIYCRRVTQAWCLLLLINVLVSVYTAFATSLQFWSLYNGVIVYCVFGGMLLGEYLLRLRLRRKWEQA